jgi:hypothetical protein
MSPRPPTGDEVSPHDPQITSEGPGGGLPPMLETIRRLRWQSPPPGHHHHRACAHFCSCAQQGAALCPGCMLICVWARPEDVCRMLRVRWPKEGAA